MLSNIYLINFHPFTKVKPKAIYTIRRASFKTTLLMENCDKNGQTNKKTRQLNRLREENVTNRKN